MSGLTDILDIFRITAHTEREKGNYFENLAKLYFQHEPRYQDLYCEVWLWEAWRANWIKAGHLDPGADTGIDLVAKTNGTAEYHAIQAKFYDSDSTIYKKQVDSFFTASGKMPFTHRLLILSTDKISPHVDTAMHGQHTPCQKITLSDLEDSKIDWAKWFTQKTVELKEQKTPRPYQTAAIANVVSGLEHADRGKLIMACGTGKTFTSLRLAEQMAGAGKRVLFLVPSLSLLSQTLTEWTQETATPMHSFAVCSDSEVGKGRDKDDDYQMLVHELQYPATTNPKMLAHEITKRHDAQHMSVVFSTYHSIDVISQAQKLHALADFDLIICDEAHRTTGASFDGDDESAFVKVHNQDVIKGEKRVYMTATPRVYGVPAKAKAENDSIILYSMDNAEFFGETLHTLSFSEAVHGLGILCDYKVIVLTISEDHINAKLQVLLKDGDNNLRVDDAAKIIGCWRALSKQDTQDDLSNDPDPMRRAVAFCQVIEVNKGAKSHKVSSKNIAQMFQAVVDEYRTELLKENPEQQDAISQLVCEAQHVDGGMNAAQKGAKLNWLKAELPDNTCRILSNVRCLSEGVDVPALDAVLFLTPRNSQVDVVQSVGRVMRKPKDSKKKLGYVILPVVIPAGMQPEEALNDNKTYKVVWEVLQALRSHDDRFDAMINKLDLTGQDKSKMEIIAITDTINIKSKGKANETKGAKVNGKAAKAAKGGQNLGQSAEATPLQEQQQIEYHVSEIERAIVAKVVQKCGNRLYWDEWAKDIAKIAQTNISRITAILAKPDNTAEIAAFNRFLKELQDDLNDSISRDEAIEMLAQHIITKPVFDALFDGYSFTQHNPVSKAMQGVLEVLNEHNLDKEAATLERFYESVRMRAAGISDLKAKQKIIVDLYDKFFSSAFPRLKDKLGIVYTPVEVVDFIIHSVNDVLKREFGQTLGSKGVHIIDPFTGTGTFITRLLQSGLIGKDELAHKFQNEIHANEIVLLAYYIAAINIEQVYHAIMGGDYVPFGGICLTDTFALYEPSSHLIGKDSVADNSTRRRKQKTLDIRVIVGNPPYSAGQTSANDNNANVGYPTLDESIRKTYAAHSTATNKNALYDSYIRAIRWASDRIGTSGVVGYVSNGGFIDANTADGLRKCLAEEFSSIYIFHLRGNQRTSGELSRQEGGKIFGAGSRSPIAISILVKNPKAIENGKIYLHDIGDYLSREEKLEKITAFGSIDGITAANGWLPITPDQHNDWVGQRDDSFSAFMSMGDKKDDNAVVMFANYSRGIATSRDAWCYNSSKDLLSQNMQRMVSFYNEEVSRYSLAVNSVTNSVPPVVSGFINTDSTKISWSDNLRNGVLRGKLIEFAAKSVVQGVYRPFSKQWLCYSRSLNDRVYQFPQIFPLDMPVDNLVICVTGRGETVDFSALISDTVPNLHTVSSGQCFPLKLFEIKPPGGLFDTEPKQGNYTIRDGITDSGLQIFKDAYKGEAISKEDLFYYIYGLLHSEDYKKRYADNLSKELPRIPAVKKFSDFQAFSTAGRKLADLHINYETVAPYQVDIEGGALLLAEFTEADYRVTQMKFASKADKTRVVYNHKITMSGIPLEAYDYVVNGKPALEWVMERQAVTTHKDSGIVNDANLWATETVGDAAYPLKLFQRVITVSLETMKLVRALPRLDIAVAKQ
uniref:Helicase n=1 Tax=Polaromonas sp. W10N TaxID=1840301 RepID=A0A2S1FIG5_9BURK|nr:type ISP restriction/modification enzyme [Polaromonas sp. W10N]AWD72312.1 helicase [Polaromonas sp. W10N]